MDRVLDFVLVKHGSFACLYVFALYRPNVGIGLQLAGPSTALLGALSDYQCISRLTRGKTRQRDSFSCQVGECTGSTEK